MSHFRELTQPKTMRDGLVNAVQLIVNQLESKRYREAKLQAVDLVDSLTCGVYDGALGVSDALAQARIDARVEREATEAQQRIDRARAEGFADGVTAHKREAAEAFRAFMISIGGE